MPDPDWRLPGAGFLYCRGHHGGMSEAACAHESGEFLGEDAGRNRYYRCGQCGATLISDGKQVWAISDLPTDLRK